MSLRSKGGRRGSPGRRELRSNADHMPWRPDDPPTEPFSFAIDLPPWPVSPELPHLKPQTRTQSAGETALEPDRFTDLTLYQGAIYAPADCGDLPKLTDATPLLTGQGYTLEVAIRRIRSGIGADQVAGFAVLNPRQAVETLTILVSARTIYGPLAIENTVTRFSWPHDQDSTPAYFRLCPTSLSQPSMCAQIEVRLYHSNLDLLDVVRLTVTVATDAQVAASGSEVLWFRDGRAQPALDPDTAVRAVSIGVELAKEGYCFRFLFVRGENKTELLFVRFIRLGDLQALLRRVRDFWTRLAITAYADKLTVSVPTWKRYVAKLRDIGLKAWALLFGDAEGDARGGAEEVGELLRTLDLGRSTHIQITYEDSVADFVFPWALLYPPGEPEAVDLSRFWGVRFQIEQVSHGRKEDGLSAELVDAAIAIDPRFGMAEAQERMFTDLIAGSSGRLTVTHRSTDKPTLLRALQGDPASHLYYFFCHGYAPMESSVFRPDGVQMLEKVIADAPDGAKVVWQTLLTLTARMKDEAWIFLGDSEVTESDLQNARGFFCTPRRPLVFMNMCHSAALLPSMSSGLVRLFLRRSASAVIGTEAPMTSVFAHAFAEQFFASLFAGNDVGTALSRARLYFLTEDRRNLLGLAYTLYGRATVKICKTSIVPVQADTYDTGTD